MRIREIFKSNKRKKLEKRIDDLEDIVFQLVEECGYKVVVNGLEDYSYHTVKKFKIDLSDRSRENKIQDNMEA